MKKVIVVFLALLFLLAGCSGVAQAEYDVLEEEYEELEEKYDFLRADYVKKSEKLDELQADYDNLEADYKEKSEKLEELQADYDALKAKGEPEDTLLSDSWGLLLSDKSSGHLVNDETIIVVIYAEGRTMDEMLDEIKEHIATFPFLLSTDELSTGIIVVMNDDNEVWFGYTITAEGESIPFLSENFVNNS